MKPNAATKNIYYLLTKKFLNIKITQGKTLKHMTFKKVLWKKLNRSLKTMRQILMS